MVSFLRAPLRRGGADGLEPVPTASLTLAQRATCHMAVSLLLDYPDEASFNERVAAAEEALAALPEAVASQLGTFTQVARERGTRALAEHYVATFDQRRRCCLYLSYYAVGDTRHRGAAILAFKEALAGAGFELERDELPDYLPLVLEASAQAAAHLAQASGGVEPATYPGESTDPASGGVGTQAQAALSLEMIDALLAAHREGIEVLRAALADAGSPYVHLAQALIATLPQIDPATADRVRALVSAGPPTETVGVTDRLPFPTLPATTLAGSAAALTVPGLARHDAPPITSPSATSLLTRQEATS